MTQIRDLIKKMADFFTSEEFYEKGEDARLELSPDDVRRMYYLIQQRNKDKDKIKAEIEEQVLGSLSDGGDDWFAAEKVNECLEIIDKYKAESECEG